MVNHGSTPHEIDREQTLPAVGQIWARLAGRSTRLKADFALALLDLVLATSSFTAMLVLRYDGTVPSRSWTNFLSFLPVAIFVVVASNIAWGLYGQLWRHASLYEARRLVLSGCTLTGVLLLFEWRPRNVPLSVIIGGSLLVTFLMALVRFQRRLFSFRRHVEGPGMRVVVIGAGDAGASLVADMLRSPRAGFTPVAVLDEDPALHRRSFMGIPVEGDLSDLTAVVSRTGAHLAVFAMTSAPQKVLQRAAAAAESADVALKIIPGMSSAMRGGISLRDIRDVRIEDLLGRKEVAVDLASVRSMLCGERVLITGAGGSIGSEIARQVLACEPEHLALVDHDETHLHEIAGELRSNAVQVLADIRDRALMLAVFEAHRPSIVFHAAAHKHVPLLEAHPCEAVRTNVVGTANVLEAAQSVGADRLVFISTDKAVYPSSVMGATKRVGEQLVLARTPQRAAYCAVRFGNVLGSRGSVVPTFMRQIESGGPVTVTDRRMTRFFMSIEEAVQLVLQAAALSRPDSGGEVFMLDMGDPVIIYDLAERMIRLAGHKPGTDIEIEISGARPGEKLAEELVALDEAQEETSHASIHRVIPIPIGDEKLEHGVLRLDYLVRELADEECHEQLKAMALVERRSARIPSVGDDGG